jgi:hypothetical protein
MSIPLGPVEVTCDAPPYAVVEGCRLIGLDRPEDVRWCRADRPRLEARSWLSRLCGRNNRAVKDFGGPREVTCRCGESFIGLMKYLFLFDTGHEVCYRIGQCKRCGSIYWDHT